MRSIGVNNRRHSKGPKLTSAKRLYLLRSLVRCVECGANMRGATQSSRGVSLRYYACPTSERHEARLGPDGNLVECHARRIRAADVEGHVLDALNRFLVPPEEMEAAQRELRRRVAQGTEEGGSDKERARLQAASKRLREMFKWGHITEADYRKDDAEVRGQISALPGESGKVIGFSRYRRIAASLPDAIANATPEQVAELLPAIVERVGVRDRQVAELTWTPPAQPSSENPSRARLRC